ncbi:SDR family oxidoreductase [Pseudorhodoplanes sp.]|uniref:SDR family oxidoreductase n=1 Tax=Pseudorhodoplanes sp. TaxID=1934341 RepID=UPI002BFA6161|nr:SDR family oxidoreductase [Pseudorhodoplanes sp.]HWV40183.1 SDR family oxidoreductase [Pseudorhodoplanes sp.]
MSRSIKDLMDLSGRVAVVTGGAGHIGREICDTLAELGAAVVVVDRQGAKTCADRVASDFSVKTLALDIDLSDEAATRSIAASVERRFGRCDILINNAAFVGTSNLIGWAVPFAEQSAETWRQAIEVNLTAVFALSQSLAPLLSSRGGSIVNIASIYGNLGPDWRRYKGTVMGNPAAYAASKGGLIQLTRWLATTLSPQVRVNAISPGGVERAQPQAFADQYNAQTPLGRMAREEDFKGAIAFLASDASAYVTGQNLMVDGGYSAW